jgi:hypothetical protein
MQIKKYLKDWVCIMWNHKPVFDDDPEYVWCTRCKLTLVEGEDYDFE